MSTLTLSMIVIAITCYVATWTLLVRQLKTKEINTLWQTVLITAGLIGHAISIFYDIFYSGIFQLGFFQAASVLFLVMNTIVFFSNMRLPLKNTFLMLLPFSVLALVCLLLFGRHSNTEAPLSFAMLTHILLSITAYSLLTIATLQALLLAYQHKRLKSHNVKPLLGVFPPLQTVEHLLFDFVRAGFALLTLAIVTGVLFIENIFEQHLAHKLAFSVLSWLIYVVLLTGRHVVGWRGQTAIRWVIAGFIMLMIAYFGSKFVLEIVLSAGT